MATNSSQMLMGEIYKGHRGEIDAIILGVNQRNLTDGNAHIYDENGEWCASLTLAQLDQVLADTSVRNRSVDYRDADGNLYCMSRSSALTLKGRLESRRA